MLPLPSRTHPKNKTWVVYTEELTHLSSGFLSLPDHLRRLRSRGFRRALGTIQPSDY
jgi:hypothetical protein